MKEYFAYNERRANNRANEKRRQRRLATPGTGLPRYTKVPRSSLTTRSVAQ